MEGTAICTCCFTMFYRCFSVELVEGSTVHAHRLWFLRAACATNHRVCRPWKDPWGLARGALGPFLRALGPLWSPLWNWDFWWILMIFGNAISYKLENHSFIVIRRLWRWSMVVMSCHGTRQDYHGNLPGVRKDLQKAMDGDGVSFFRLCFGCFWPKCNCPALLSLLEFGHVCFHICFCLVDLLLFTFCHTCHGLFQGLARSFKNAAKIRKDTVEVPVQVKVFTQASRRAMSVQDSATTCW